MNEVTGLVTVEAAQDWLREQLPEGATCPVCAQHARLYRRRLNAGMARALIAMYRANGTEWLHKPTVLRGLGASARDESLLRFWNLIEEAPARRSDGGRAGWWRVTKGGEAFVRGQVGVPSHVLVYNGRCYGLDGERITIREALGSKFDYDELMGWP